MIGRRRAASPTLYVTSSVTSVLGRVDATTHGPDIAQHWRSAYFIAGRRHRIQIHEPSGMGRILQTRAGPIGPGRGADLDGKKGMPVGNAGRERRVSMRLDNSSTAGKRQPIRFASLNSRQAVLASSQFFASVKGGWRGAAR